MSEREKYEAQGRAHAALREARSNAATCAAELRAYGEMLSATARELSVFVDLPRENVTLMHALKEDIGRLVDKERIWNLIEDLRSETQRAAELQEQVDRF